MNRSNLAWALDLAERRWPVFPLLPGGKRPALHGDSPSRPCPRTGACAGGHQGWEQLATCDPRLIEIDWGHNPDHNIGLACGPAGLVVLDLDVAEQDRDGEVNGAEVLKRLAAEHHASLPRTWTVITPSEGIHYYYRAPAGVLLGNTHHKLGNLIDTRAHGGYVVAPGSTLPAGGYRLEDDRDPVMLPDWLLRLLTQESPARSLPRPPAPVADLDLYTMAAARGEYARVRGAEPGDHNRSLYGAACNLGEVVAGLLAHAAEPRVGMDCDCDREEIERVIGLGLQRGARNPRRFTVTSTFGRSPGRGT